MDIYNAVVGREMEVPLWFGVTTGLTLATLDSVDAIDGTEIIDFEDDLGASLEEIGGVPGYYLLTFVPRRSGTLYLNLVDGAVVNEFVVQSVLPVPPMVADPSIESDHTITVQVGGDNVPGATVRVYNEAGTTLLARGLTDSQGQVTFVLEAGAYQTRVSKVGYDFASVNPTDIIVIPNDNIVPRLDEILPSSASIGDTVTLLGQFFDDEESEVMFGAATPEPALFVSPVTRALMVVVPAGLTDLAIPVRVRKPDPENPGEYFLSNVVTLTRVP